MMKTLTSEQVARYERIDWSRRLFQHRAGVHMTVLQLATALGLSDDQWQRLEQLLLKEDASRADHRRAISGGLL